MPSSISMAVTSPRVVPRRNPRKTTIKPCRDKSRIQIVTRPVREGLGSPTALGMAAFSVTLTTLSLSLMGWRNVSTDNAFIGNFLFIAGIGMIISAQWELVRGDTYAYTSTSAFGFFYGGFGAILTPIFGVRESYGDDIVQYNNALGLFMIMWSGLTLFLLFGAIPINLAYIGIYFFTDLSFTFIAASYFATADGNLSTSSACRKAGGAFGFLAGMCGWYTMFHLMAQRTFHFSFPLGDTSRFFKKRFRTPGDL